MKLLLAAISGFALSLGIFIGGVAFAVTYLSADPVPVQQLAADADTDISTDVRRIDLTKQHFERIVAGEPESFVSGNQAVVETNEAANTLLPETGLAALSAEHVTWCQRRYRSYDAATNTYRPFSGGTRECVSPHQHVAEHGAQFETTALNQQVDHAGVDMLEQGHVENCFARYRSYRPEDNSYQPYGGGPRLPCDL